MHLATFNVLHGRSPSDDRVDLDRFADAVRTLDADVLALQEVDRDQPRSDGADLTRIAAEAIGAVAAQYAPALTGFPGGWSRAAVEEVVGEPAYGVALLSRYPLLDARVVRLPVLRGRVPVLFPGRRHPVLVADEPRVALVARLEVPGGALTAVSTHLSFIPWWNVVQLHHLARALRASEPLVLMGDLNMRTARAVRATGLRPLATGSTYPAHGPDEQIDHLLARGVHPTSPGRVHRLPMSDHCALTVQAQLG